MESANEYEQARRKNINDNQSFLKELMKDFKPVPTPKKYVRKTAKRKSESENFVLRRSGRSSARFNPYGSEGPRTRARSRRHSDIPNRPRCPSPSEEDTVTDGKLLVRFGMYSEATRPLEERDENVKMVRERHVSSQREIRPAADISEEEIIMVADHTSEKKLDVDYGTTCHQCRQKTLDMKTICRSEECRGARGAFCGPCLRNRYGQDAKEALKDDDWICPPCRGICNCSICRRKSGRGCTGILVHLAKEYGYDNVDAYLKSMAKN